MFVARNRILKALLIFALFSSCAKQHLSTNALAPNGTSVAQLSFAGVQSVAYVSGDKLMIRWNQATHSESQSVSYKIYIGKNASDNPSTPVAMVTDLTTALVDIPAGTTVAQVRVVASATGVSEAGASVVKQLNIDANAIHPAILQIGTGAVSNSIDGVYPQDFSRTISPLTVAPDKNGNLFWFDNGVSWTVNVVCTNVTAPGACYQKHVGKNYVVAGNSIEASPVSASDPKQTSLNEVRGITTDTYGNVYLADYGANLVAVVCYDVSAPGACSGLTADRLYVIAGTGAGNDTGGQNTAPTSVPVAVPAGVQVDSLGNLYIASYRNNPKVRVICYDTSVAGHFCAGKTAGNIYDYAGQASEGFAADGILATTGSLGRIYSIEFDQHENLLIAELRNVGRSVRVVCNYNPASLAGICAGKTAGYLYRIIGTGTLGDSAGGVAAETANIGDARSVTVDNFGNIWVADNTAPKLRVRCQDVTSAGNFCQGKTQGFLYNFLSQSINVAAGTSVSTPNALPLENIGTGSVKFDRSTGNLIYGTGNFVSIIRKPQ